MAIEYSWKVRSVKAKQQDGLDRVIYQTYWIKTGIDENGLTGEFHGATPLRTGNINEDDFVAFEDLTQEQVIAWIEELNGGDAEDHINEQIQKQIDDQKNMNQEIEEDSLPWNL